MGRSIIGAGKGFRHLFYPSRFSKNDKILSTQIYHTSGQYGEKVLEEASEGCTRSGEERVMAKKKKEEKRHL
jgi:hypothetical protein